MVKQFHPTRLLLLMLAALAGGCGTTDFPLYKGMSRTDADAVLESYGVHRSDSTTRPANGWPDDSHTLRRMALRARWVEAEQKTRIQTVDYYGVGYGFMGYRWLFLFYDPQDVLIDFYQHQIN